MKANRILMAILLALALEGCTYVSLTDTNPKEPIASEVPLSNRGIASIATEGRVTEVASTEDATSAAGIVMTVNSPAIMLTPIQGNSVPAASTPIPLSRDGWQTFTGTTLGITVDYPIDWTVVEQADGATFTSPQGAIITLQLSNASSDNNETRIGNQYCTIRENSYNLTADICADHASFSYSAKFTFISANSSTQWLILTTTTRATGNIFETMFNSVRQTK